MISNKSIRNICFFIAVISLIIILFLYFCPNDLSIDDPIGFSRNLFFSIFGSTLVSGLTAHIYISSQIKETHISIALKLNQACYILSDPTNNHMLHDYPFEIVKANYEKVYSLINDAYFIMKDFELKSMSRFPVKKDNENISSLSIISNICNDLRDANSVLLELYREMSSPHPDDGKITELWRELPPLRRKATENTKLYLIKIYGKNFVETTDFNSIYRLNN